MGGGGGGGGGDEEEGRKGGGIWVEGEEGVMRRRGEKEEEYGWVDGWRGRRG